MSITTIAFPAGNKRSRPKPPTAHHLPLNNQRHHPAQFHPHTPNPAANDPIFPLPPSLTGGSSKPRPYHLNDFANNHLFIAKRKIAQALHGRANKEVQSTNDLLYLFDEQESKQKGRMTSKPKRRESMMNKTSSSEQDLHLSVLNLRVSPPYSSTQSRERASAGLIRPFEFWSGVKNFTSM